jgi:hypothetical protein
MANVKITIRKPSVRMLNSNKVRHIASREGNLVVSERKEMEGKKLRQNFWLGWCHYISVPTHMGCRKGASPSKGAWMGSCGVKCRLNRER